MSRQILLTGATGALGPQLAAELLAAEASDHVHALVRAAQSSAEERFENWAKTVSEIQCHDLRKESTDRDSLVDESDIEPRLHLATGDVTEDGLGMDPSARRKLAQQIEIIIHAAADTKFRGSADAQWNVNVKGTRRMLEFAANCPRLRQFILVSTICVAGKNCGQIPEEFFTPDGFVNEYERTKWEAERLALASDLPLRVARVGVVMGSRVNGAVHRLGALHHILRWFGHGMIPLVPGTPQSNVELIDVETVCQFLARAASEEAIAHCPNKAIWHVTAGDQTALLTELMETTWEAFNQHQTSARGREKGRLVDAQTFERIRRAYDRRGDASLGNLMESIDSFLPGLLYPRQFETAQAEQLWGGKLPVADWRQTLAKVIRFIEARPARERMALARSA